MHIGSCPTSEYAELLLRSWAYVVGYRMCSTGTPVRVTWGVAASYSRPRLCLNQFLHTNLFCPPTGEQEAIVEHIEGATSALNHAITQARKEIALMREYRTLLFAEGPLDAREAARSVPDTVAHAEAVNIDVNQDMEN